MKGGLELWPEKKKKRGQWIFLMATQVPSFLTCLVSLACPACQAGPTLRNSGRRCMASFWYDRVAPFSRHWSSLFCLLSRTLFSLSLSFPLWNSSSGGGGRTKSATPHWTRGLLWKTICPGHWWCMARTIKRDLNNFLVKGLASQ